MGLFRKSREEYAAQREAERQRLMALDEKALLVEIALRLEEISMQCNDIQHKQIIFGN